MKKSQILQNNSIQVLTILMFTIAFILLLMFTEKSVQGSTVSFENSIDQPLKNVHDAYGNPIFDETGEKLNYLLSSGDNFIRMKSGSEDVILDTEELSVNPFDKKIRNEYEIFSKSKSLAIHQSTSDYLTQAWKTGLWGTGIGASGLTAFDIDNDGVSEIVAGGGYGFGGNKFWYILSYSAATGNYQQEWSSREYASTISRLLVADVDGTGQYTIYVALSNGEIEVYDAATHELIDTFSSPFGSLADITIADVDNDGEQEIITSSSNGIVVHHAQTFAVEWQTSSYGSNEVEVANVDSDAALEIVTTSQVIDGISHTLDWNYTGGFGAIIQLADIDGDNMAEIIAAESWYQLNAFDADIQSPKWDIPVDLDIDALIVTDFDNDNVQEIVYGDGQWGAVYAINSVTLAEEWHINNPEHGVAGIGFGDVDNDGTVEVLWGAGWSSTGSDHLFVGSTVAHNIEWRSQDIGGPLSALDVGDVDNDGTNEIVMVSFESDSGYDDGIIFIYDAETYELEWQSDPILNGRAWTGVHALELADVDNDNVLEILIATADLYDGLIMAYDGISHNLDWQTVDHNGTHFSALAVGDIDNDGQLEVIGGQDREHTGAAGVYVRVFDGSTGIEEWRTTNLTYWGGVYDIDTGDFDQDGNPEILFSVTDGNAYVYDGITHAQEWKSSFTNTRAVAGMDVDQDGDTEILVGTSSGQLYAFDGETNVQEWSESFSSQSINSLRLDDINSDLVSELILTDNSFLFVYDAITHDPIWQSEDLGSSVGKKGHLVVDDIDNDTHYEIVLGSNFAMYVFEFTPGFFFDSNQYNVGEADSTATITVTLNAPLTETVTVEYYTLYQNTAEEAIPDQDYIPVSGTLSFAPGSQIESFNISIIDNDLAGENKIIQLHISDAAPEGAVFAQDDATLTIIDDDDDGGDGFYIYLPSIMNNYCSNFFDNFSNSASGWEISDDSYARAEYLNGEYRILSKLGGYLYMYDAPTCNRDNYTVEVDARWQGTVGSSYGLLFDLADNNINYYIFMVNTDYKQFRLYVHTSSGFAEIVPVTDSSAINGGTASNHLSVTRDGNLITLSINGTNVKTLSNSIITGTNRVGLYASAYSTTPNSDTRFDNFSVNTIQATSVQNADSTISKTYELDAPQSRIETLPDDLGW